MLMLHRIAACEFADITCSARGLKVAKGFLQNGPFYSKIPKKKSFDCISQ
jgi:hypothetical protein